MKRFGAWLYGYGSPVTLGLLRILMAWMVLWQVGIMLGDFEAFYTENGFVPIHLVNRFLDYPSNVIWGGTPLQTVLPGGPPRLAPLNAVTDANLTLGVMLAVWVAAVFYLVGYRTRIFGWILALGLVSLHTRNILVIHSGDTLLRLCIIYLAFSKCGEALSLDRVFGCTKGEEIPLWPQRLIAIQVALVYGMTVWWKWQGITWKEGTATWFPSVMDEFYRLPVPPITEGQPFVMLTTYGTLIAELALALLVWFKPLRRPVLIIGVLLHAYIEWRFTIPMFSWVIVATYVSYYEGDEVRRWWERLGEKLQKRFPWTVATTLPDAARERLNALGWPRFVIKS